MSLNIPVSPDTEAKLREKAEAIGEDVASYAAGILERTLWARQRLEEISGPIYKRFQESGMTDDELGEFLEKEKHAMRAEKRARRGAQNDTFSRIDR